MLNHTNETKASQVNGLVRLFSGAVVGATLMLCASGCTMRVRGEADYVYDDPAVEVVQAPPEYYSYPRYSYRGGYAYYVNDRWYYEGPRGWVAFHTAPPELAERRVYVSRGSAPRHYEAHPRVYEERRRAPAAPVERSRRYYKR